jgi:membrane-bound lytic murein transglycosylase D
MVRVLEELDLPPELWVLTLLESGLNPRARSRSGAVGVWQFVARTGEHYDLLITSDRDERRDWEAATQAAARYLADLRRHLGDGLLALAGFNCGPYCVRRAMKEAGATEFWELDLPRETEQYVPKALALIDLLGAGGREPHRVEASKGFRYEWARVTHPVLISDLARVCGLGTEDLRRLNPSWKRQITPMDGHPVLARVPPGRVEAVREALADGTLAEARDPHVHKVQRGETLWSIARNYEVKLGDLLEANNLTGKELIHPGDLIRLPGTVHRVRSGETLWGISRRYRVSLQALLETNGLSGDELIRPGLLLRIPS